MGHEWLQIDALMLDHGHQSPHPFLPARAKRRDNGLIAKACVLDTAIILAIWAFRRRREIGAWYRARRDRYLGAQPSPNA